METRYMLGTLCTQHATHALGTKEPIWIAVTEYHGNMKKSNLKILFLFRGISKPCSLFVLPPVCVSLSHAHTQNTESIIRDFIIMNLIILCCDTVKFPKI